jgi:hypothetical protein
MLSVHLVYTQCILSVYSVHVAIILQQTDYQKFTENSTTVVYIVYIFLSTKTEIMNINSQPKSVYLTIRKCKKNSVQKLCIFRIEG